VEEHTPTPKAEAAHALMPGPRVVVIDKGKPYVEAQASVWGALIGGR